MKHALAGLFVLLSAPSLFAGANDYFSEFAKDFGTTPRGPVLTHYFTLKNTTNSTVNIGSARVSCGCVSATVMKNTLAPGESTAVFAAMDTRRIPQAYVTKTVTVYVPFFAPNMEEVQLKVTAIARDDMVLTPEGLAFGSLKAGKGGNTSVRVTLYNNPNFTITEASSTGLYVKPEFKQVSKAGNEVTYEVTATLDPKCPVGNWMAEIWLKSNVAGVEKFRIPVSVVVTTPISVTPDPVNLSDLEAGQEKEQKVVLQGNQAFKVLQVKGVDDVIGVKAGSEESRATHILIITVKPTKSGGIEKLLEVETDHKEMPKLSIPVKATVK